MPQDSLNLTMHGVIFSCLHFFGREKTTPMWGYSVWQFTGGATPKTIIHPKVWRLAILRSMGRTDMPSSYLDIGTRQVILSHDEIIQIDVVWKRHTAGVNLKDMPLGFLIGEWELDFTIDTTRSDQSRVQCLYPVGSHYHLRKRMQLRCGDSPYGSLLAGQPQKPPFTIVGVLAQRQNPININVKWSGFVEASTQSCNPSHLASALVLRWPHVSGDGTIRSNGIRYPGLSCMRAWFCEDRYNGLTLTSPRLSKPSSWLSSSSIVRWISRSPPELLS